jgi:hypothetical protein
VIRDYTLAGFAMLLGLACSALGLWATVDTVRYGGSELEGVVTALVYIICIPGGIISFVVGRFVRHRVLRKACLALAILTLSVPPVMGISVSIRHEMRRRELDGQMRHILRERGLPEPER